MHILLDDVPLHPGLYVSVLPWTPFPLQFNILKFYLLRSYVLFSKAGGLVRKEKVNFELFFIFFISILSLYLNLFG